MDDSEIDASAECMETLLAWLKALKSTHDTCCLCGGKTDRIPGMMPYCDQRIVSAPLLPIQPEYRKPLPGSPAAKREEILAHALGVSLV